MNTNGVDLEAARTAVARWRILVTLNAGRPAPVSEGIIHRTLGESDMTLSPMELRRELAYLEDRKLVIIRHREGPTWSAELTHHGIDVVEYTVDCHPGIDRPKKWW